ncbi:properdin-like [Centropristis striata]|uniref:properdin-like n=1 Tax=Centropristis striata TaxID=184440 RepID=UPI0027E0199A|nr:properdin-like [Centropristis striata]
MEVLRVLLVLLVSVECSECVRCFQHFDLTTGLCDSELGDVDEESCCQNPKYGYQATDGVCRSCGSPIWSEWTPWSLCSVTCDDGVMQRRRTCYGTRKSQCDKPEHTLETTRCNNTCCDGRGWGQWLSWSSCSVSCGEGGVKRRQRVCSVAAECQLACGGQSEETETCPTTTCPVHGGWSSWSEWSQCSGTCNDDQNVNVPVPVRQRQRECTSPAPSRDTSPPGNNCPGDKKQVQDCGFLPNCPVAGAWGAWSPAGQCSVTCGEGLQLSIRRCDSPAPKYGGQMCPGQSTMSQVCQSPCPVDGFWSGWTSWSDCSEVCQQKDNLSGRIRQRTCSNPAPSVSPPGNSCHGDNTEADICDVPHCPVDGAWGPWSPFSSCSVSCSVGLMVSDRRCNSPAPNYGGQPCPGDGRKTQICETGVPCPVDGVWSEWSLWQQCLYRNPQTKINCRHLAGSQTRDRFCLHRDFNGSICNGELRERRVCYDVDKCRLEGTWSWEPWRMCRENCGTGRTTRARRMRCEADYSSYRQSISGQNVTFFGNPDCGNAPRPQVEHCNNLPACT